MTWSERRLRIWADLSARVSVRLAYAELAEYPGATWVLRRLEWLDRVAQGRLALAVAYWWLDGRARGLAPAELIEDVERVVAGERGRAIRRDWLEEVV